MEEISFMIDFLISLATTWPCMCQALHEVLHTLTDFNTQPPEMGAMIVSTYRGLGIGSRGIGV